jgi:hypothetical protein
VPLSSTCTVLCFNMTAATLCVGVRA